MKWNQIPIDYCLMRALCSRGAEWVKAYQSDDVHVIITPEPYLNEGRIGLHMSVSAYKRDPTWEEQKAARYDLLPDDKVFAQFLPPAASFDTLGDSHVFHWFEVDPGPVSFVHEGWL